VGFEVLTAVVIDVIVLCDIPLAFWLLIIKLSVTSPKMAVVGSSRMLVNI
jgi:hypothetical protein